MRASESTNIMGAGTNELPEAKKAKSQLLLFLFVFVVSLIVFKLPAKKYNRSSLNLLYSVV